MDISCVITSIEWTRAHLYLDVEVSLLEDSQIPSRYDEKEPVSWNGDYSQLTFYLCFRSQSYPLKATAGSSPGTYRLAINVTNLSDRHEIPNGTWKIVPMVKDGFGIPGTFDPGQCSHLDTASRTFLFDGNRQAYIVDLGLSDDDPRPELVVRAYHFIRDLPRKGRFKQQIRMWIRRNRHGERLVQFWYNLWHLFRSSSKRSILFAAQQRTGLEGNLLCVHDRFLARQLDRQFTVRQWHDTASKRFLARWKGRLQLARLMALSHVILLDDFCRLLDSLTPSSDTVVAQLWHAGYGFKAVGFSRFGRYGSPRLESAHRKYTHAICGSAPLRAIYAEVFGIEESAILATGLPRIDEFLNPERVESVQKDFYEKWPNLKRKRVVLFAPTFRGRGQRDAYYDYSKIDFEGLRRWCGEDGVVLFRMHHFVKEEPPIPHDCRDRLINFSDYPDTNDLLHMVDVLITDYSSIVYEFSLLNRPMLFYAYDEVEYQATRGFHGDYRDLAPGKICNTFAELLDALTTEDFEFEKVTEYRNLYCEYTDTGSTDRVIDQIILAPPKSG